MELHVYICDYSGTTLMMELSNRTEYLWPNWTEDLWNYPIRTEDLPIRTEDLWNYSNHDCEDLRTPPL